jgi:hypothetical protein
MPIDRTWYNTLVDDDGSGLTGSVWDKADVDSLIKAVDAEIKADGVAVTAALGYATATGSGQWTALNFNQVVWQTNNQMFVNPSNLITIRRPGLYLCEGNVTFEINAAGVRGLSFYVDGAPPYGLAGQQILQPATGATYSVINISAIYYLQANQFIQLAAYQSAGGNLWAGGYHKDTTNCLQVTRIGGLT